MGLWAFIKARPLTASLFIVAALALIGLYSRTQDGRDFLRDLPGGEASNTQVVVSAIGCANGVLSVQFTTTVVDPTVPDRSAQVAIRPGLRKEIRPKLPMGLSEPLTWPLAKLGPTTGLLVIEQVDHRTTPVYNGTIAAIPGCGPPS